MPDTTIYFGPPGTGKTHTLLSRVREEIDRGVPPNKIAFVAFSRRAAHEARARASEELGFDDDDLAWWRTLHSTATRELGVGGRLLDRSHWDVLGRALGMEFSDLDEDGRPSGFKRDLGHRVQRVYYLRRARGQSLEWRDLLNEFGQEFAWPLTRFHKTLVEYKRQRNLYDYADLLDEAPGTIGARVVLLDEAQDLTRQQWLYFDRLRAGAERVYVAGDDEQAVFGWAGADVARFLSLEGQRVVLDVSHRLPSAAFDVAQVISSRIQIKEPKVWRSSDRVGSVERLVDPRRLDLGTGTWLLLSRTRRGMMAWEDACRSAAVRFVTAGTDSVRDSEVNAIQLWEAARRGDRLDAQDLATLTALARGTVPRRGAPIWHAALVGIPLARRHYYEAVLRQRGTRELRDPARVRIDTIHGAKGAEADRVAIFPDLTPQIERGLRADPDAEHRVWYVAATRCREALYVARPITDLAYPL